MAKEKTWIKYEREGEGTDHVKMHMRNMVKTRQIMCRNVDIRMTQKEDYFDDKYVLRVDGEDVEIISRELGQRNEEKPGVFYFADSEDFEKKSKIEEMLAQVLR